MRIHFTGLVLISLFLMLAGAMGQEPSPKAGGKDKSFLKKFDTNGDGQIDENERRAVRGKMKQIQKKPGATTPSAGSETIKDRIITEMQFPSSDGKMIPCVLSMPKGDGPFPMLVTIHGGQGNRDYAYIRSMAAPNNLSPTISAFNEQPWAILAISYRAGNGALFGMEQDDVVEGIRFAKRQPKVDPNRVGVVGGSHGGHLALVAAEKMGREFLCVAVGSPWMTDPVVYMTGDPGKPPLSMVPAEARDDLLKNGRRILNGMKRGRNMSDQEVIEFVSKHSIEANADKIEIPALFVTSLGDSQAPHALIEPMIHRMKGAKKDVEVYTAEKSPHGFYWARTVSAARVLRGEKTQQEEKEELEARRRIIQFFTRQFARTDAKTDQSPVGNRLKTMPQGKTETSSKSEKKEEKSARDRFFQPKQEAYPKDKDRVKEGPGASSKKENEWRKEPGKAAFESLADESGSITRQAFKKHATGLPAIAKRPELSDRLFDRLDLDGDGVLNKAEIDGMKNLKGQFERGGQPVKPKQDSPKTGADSGSSGQTTSRQTADNSGAIALSAKTPPVRIPGGELVGEQVGDVKVFRGVHYASAPVAELRWRPPAPFRGWKGSLDATRFGATSLQGETFSPRGSQSEDCLFLNIWAPAKTDAESRLPVLFWIHGGAFIQGSGAQPRYDGTELARRGVVVVTINYRLGPLGLFAHPTLTADAKPDDPLGNYCLLDMIAALGWTRENIAAFGGDPGNVTISGSSAGGTSCLFLMGIPQARGLFHKAIIHSSGGIQNIQTLAEAEAAGVRLSEHIGLGPNPSSRDLRSAMAGDIALGVAAIRDLKLPVKPIVDGRLVTGAPAEIFARGKQARIPVMIGSANGESGARLLEDEIATGGAFGFQRKLADDMTRAGQSVYMFQLTYVPPLSRANRSAAKHGETVAYAFGTFGQSVLAQYGFLNKEVASKASRPKRGGHVQGNENAGREDDFMAVEDSEQGRKISAAMMEYWVAFMREGKPSGRSLPKWPAHEPKSPKAMVFGNEKISVK